MSWSSKGKTELLCLPVDLDVQPGYLHVFAPERVIMDIFLVTSLEVMQKVIHNSFEEQLFTSKQTMFHIPSIQAAEDPISMLQNRDDDFGPV